MLFLLYQFIHGSSFNLNFLNLHQSIKWVCNTIIWRTLETYYRSPKVNLPPRFIDLYVFLHHISLVFIFATYYSPTPPRPSFFCLLYIIPSNLEEHWCTYGTIFVILFSVCIIHNPLCISRLFSEIYIDSKRQNWK